MNVVVETGGALLLGKPRLDAEKVGTHVWGVAKVPPQILEKVDTQV